MMMFDHDALFEQIGLNSVDTTVIH